MAKNFNISADFKIKDFATKTFGKLGKQANMLARQFRSVTGAGSHLVGSVGKILAPLTVATGVAGTSFVNGIKSAQQYADSIGDLSERLGVSSKFLQEQNYLAEMNAGSAEEMTSAIETLSRQYGALQSGTGKLYTGLQKISPAFAAQMKGAKSSEEAYELLINAIRKVEDPAKKMYLSTLAFGNSGKTMLNVAAQSADRLNELKKEANDLGVVMDEKAIKSAGDLGDSMTQMQKSVQGVFNQLAGKLMPILVPFIQRITDWIKANKELIGTKINKFVQQFADLLKKIDLEAILNAISSFASACLKVTDILTGLNKWIILIGVALASGLVCNFVSAAMAIGKFVMMIPGVSGALGVLVSILKAAGIALIKFGIAFLATPFGWVVAGIAAVVAGIILLWNKCDAFRNFIIGFFEGIKKIGEAIGGFIADVVWSFMHPIDALMEKIEKLKKIGGWIANKLGFGSDEETKTSSAESATPMPQTLGQVNPYGSNNSKTEVVVKFDNMPKEAAVQKVSQEGKADLGVEYGYAMGGAA